MDKKMNFKYFMEQKQRMIASLQNTKALCNGVLRIFPVMRILCGFDAG